MDIYSVRSATARSIDIANTGMNKKKIQTPRCDKPKTHLARCCCCSSPAHFSSAFFNYFPVTQIKIREMTTVSTVPMLHEPSAAHVTFKFSRHQTIPNKQTCGAGGLSVYVCGMPHRWWMWPSSVDEKEKCKKNERDPAEALKLMWRRHNSDSKPIRLSSNGSS